MKFEQVWSGRCCVEGDDGLFSATVPGNIQYDYGVAHGFGDVNYSDHYKQYLPLENDHWEYITHLNYEKHGSERVFFVCEGIDYRYDILLNGTLLYAYEGMFRSVELDLTNYLNGKDDVLTVHIYPHPKRAGAPERTRAEASASCKPPVSYGWDWNPRLLISGIWQEACIETRDECFIGHCEVLASLDETLKTGTVRFSFDCLKDCETALYDADENPVYIGTDREITVENPELWWCNGQGTPYLYRWVVRNEKDERSGYIGFRRLRLVRNEGADVSADYPKTRYDAPITIELNGRRIFAKGSNWVNPDVFWGRVDRARYEELLVLVRDCNMNLLRVWGGASMCKKPFYELCDRYGILVWQEFMLACNNYIGTPHYLSVLESEATAIIQKLRAHPCLALWCGGNELFNSWSGMDDQSLALRLLNKLCFDLDPDRPFMATAPLIGMAHGGYLFYHDNQGGDVFGEFQRVRCTAYSEFGVPSISSVETLREIIPEDELFPINDTPSWIAHHGFHAWGHHCWLCLPTIEKYFGKLNSLEEIVDRSNWLQCAGYQAAFEEIRKQWPHCSMALNWVFDEPWKTAANNCLVAYPTRPKPAYEVVKAALRPKLFSARVPHFAWATGDVFEAELWLLNDSQEYAEGKVRVSIEIGNTVMELLEWTAQTDVNRNAQGPTARCVLPDAETDRFVLVLDSDTGMSNRYTLRYHRKAQAVAPKLRIMNQ